MTVDAALLAWLRSRLPETAAVAIAPIGRPDCGRAVGDLIGDEQTLIARARPARRAEFQAGRIAARQALAEMGFGPFALMAHPAGDPIWPEGVVGSISHAMGWAVAVAAPRDRVRGLGLDLEGAEPLEPGLVDLVCRPEERGPEPALASLGFDAPKLRFVAKEAWYKAVFPEWRDFIGFEEAVVAFDPAAGTFHARYVGRGPPAPTPPSARGFFMRTGDLMCAVCVFGPAMRP